MSKEEAKDTIKQLLEVLHKQGNVTVTPEVYEKLATAFDVLLAKDS